MGLGDHIICNGLIRNLINNQNKYEIFVFEKYYESISFMYRDIENLSFIQVKSDWHAKDFINKNKNKEVIIIGTTSQFFNGPFDNQFDEMFYKQHNIDFKKRWDDFKLVRDSEREMKLFNEYGVKENEYVFVHDDVTRGFYLRDGNYNFENKIVIKPKNDLTNNIFDYCYLMENAKECHFIDSSFKVLFDSISNKTTDIYHHLLLRHGHRCKTYSNSKLNFKIYN